MQSEPSNIAVLPAPEPDHARLIEQLRWEAAQLRALTLSGLTIDILQGAAGRIDAIADALGITNG